MPRKHRRTGAAGQVRSQLLADPGSMPTIDRLAELLGMTARSLQRNLAAEKTSYRALVDEVRDTLATELLTTTNLTVEQVARRLGYAETASFTHAFLHWHEVAPGQFRQLHR